MVTSKLTCVTHKCLPPLSADTWSRYALGELGIEIVATSSALDIDHRVSQVRVNRVRRRRTRRNLIGEFVLFISVFFLEDETCMNFSRGKIDPKFVQDESCPPAADGITRASCLRIACNRYTPPAPHEASEERTHVFSAQPFVRQRALRCGVQCTKSSLGSYALIVIQMIT